MLLECMEFNVGEFIINEVEVDFSKSFDDARFDYEFGSIRGAYDPGSGHIIEELKIKDLDIWDEDEKILPITAYSDVIEVLKKQVQEYLEDFFNR